MTETHIAIVVNDAAGPGAVSLVARKHAEALAARFSVTLLSDHLPDAVTLPGVDLLQISSRKFPMLRRFRHVPDLWAFWRKARAGLEELHTHRPISLVWCHSHPLAAWGAAPLKGRCGFPTAMTVHGDIFSRPRGTYDLALTALYRNATSAAYRQTNLIQVLNESAADAAVMHGARRDALRVIPNGIALKRFALPKPPREDGVLRLLFSGRLAVEKNPAFLIRILRRVKDAGVDAELTVVGDGAQGADLKELARATGLADSVRFAGRRAMDEMPACYSRADVVCIPSLSEPFSLVAIEALASGTPLLANAVEGLRERVIPGRTGWLFDHADESGWARKLVEIARHPARLREMECACREAAIPYSWDTVGERLADAVAGVLPA